MENSEEHSQSRPIGVLSALATGFDRIAAKPYLILPPLILDMFLWFGPHLTIPSIIHEATSILVLPSGADPAQLAQVEVLQDMMAIFGERFNLFASLSNLPEGMPFNLLFAIFGSLMVGMPSLMAARKPIFTPIGTASTIELSNPSSALAIWLGLGVIGLGVGALYHRLLARQIAPKARFSTPWLSWGRLLVLAVLVYVGAFSLFRVTFAVASYSGIILFGLPILYIAAVYLVFTPHGIIRYGHGIVRALRESVVLVRWNFLGTVGFLTTAFIIMWLSTTQVWVLPGEDSWFSILALLGHSFISTTLLVASYAYYQSRLGWLKQQFSKIPLRSVDSKHPEGEANSDD